MIFISFFAVLSLFLNLWYKNFDFVILLDLEEYLFFTPLLFLISKIKNDSFFESILDFTHKYSFIILFISIWIFLYKGYQFSLYPDFKARFNLESKGSLFGPVIMLGFFPLSLFHTIYFKKKFDFSAFFLVLGIFFIIYFGYLTLTRSLLLVVFYFISFQLFYGRWKVKLLLIPITVLLTVYFFISMQELRNEDDFSSGRNEELEMFNKYLDNNQIYYVIPKLFGFTKKSESNDFIGSSKMMHNGFYHLVLQFGYVIAIFIYLFLCFKLAFFFLKKQKFKFITLLNFLIISLIGTQWFSEVDMLLMNTILFTNWQTIKI